MATREGKLMDVDYEVYEDKAVILLSIRTDEGNRVIKKRNFLPYFYIIPVKGKEKMLVEKLKNLNEIPVLKIEEVILDKKCLKIYSNIPQNIPKLKDIVKEWSEVEGKREFDISFSKRFMIDENLYPMRNYSFKVENGELIDFEEISKDFKVKCLSFDIETFNNEIIMASFYSNNFRRVLTTKKFQSNIKEVIFCNSEKELVEKILSILKGDYDIIFGYNTDGFDFQIIKDKIRKYNLDDNFIKFVRKGITSSAKLRLKEHIDLYIFISLHLQQEVETETLTLRDIAREFLREEKLDLSFEDIMSFWREEKNLNLLAEYSLKDAELTYKLGMFFLNLIESISKLVGITPFEACRSTYGQLVENYLIRMAKKYKILVPNRPKREDIEKRRRYTYEGGYVLEPKQGIYENLAMFDYRSLYPSIIISHNISPDTLNCDCCEKDNLPHKFCKKKEGFIPKVLKKVIQERSDLKKRLKNMDKKSEEYSKLNAHVTALKYILNSTYGYMGYPGARWYCKECAETTTYLGRHYIKKTIEEAEKFGLNVIYGDTDSLLVQYKNKDKIMEFQKHINEKLPEYMELELEDFYKKGIFTYTKEGRGAKKRYALLSEKGELKIRGFEHVRRDWSILAKELQEKIINLILNNREKEAVELVRKTIKELRENKIPMEKLKIYTKLVKDIYTYETNIPHVVAAKKAVNKGMSLKKGQIISYIITDKPGRISDKAELFEFARNYDAEYYIKNQILPAAMRILKILGYKEDDFLNEGRQSDLMKFMGD